MTLASVYAYYSSKGQRYFSPSSARSTVHSTTNPPPPLHPLDERREEFPICRFQNRWIREANISSCLMPKGGGGGETDTVNSSNVCSMVKYAVSGWHYKGKISGRHSGRHQMDRQITHKVAKQVSQYAYNSIERERPSRSNGLHKGQKGGRHNEVACNEVSDVSASLLSLTSPIHRRAKRCSNPPHLEPKQLSLRPRDAPET